MIHRMFSPLTHFYLNLKLKHKLLLSYLFLIILPLGIFMLFSYSAVNNIMEKQLIFSANQAFNQATDFIVYKINKIIKVSDVIVANNTLNSILGKNRLTYNLPDQFKDMNDLRNYLDSFKDEDDGIQVRLYVQDTLVYSQGTPNIYSISNAMKNKWYKALIESTDKVLMCPSSYLENGGSGDGSILSVARKLKDPNDYSVVLAYLRIDFREIDVRSILAKANPVPGSLCYLQNSDNLVVSSTDDRLLAKYKIRDALCGSLLYTSGWSTETIGGEQAFVKVRAVPNTDWTIVTVIPVKEIFSEIGRLKNTMFLFMILIGTLAYTAAAYFTYSITKRIDALIKQMKVVQTGKLENALIRVAGSDEIGELIKNYNYMIHRIIDLAGEQYKMGRDLKNAELRALQAQINPHFLYNSMDMINWMSYEDKGAEIRTLVKSLSSFYKLSLNMGKDIVSIKDELSHASLYVQIQNFRLKNHIHLLTEVDENLQKQGIMRITLQPIIENSILHGIMERPEKEGTIRILGETEGETIRLIITDDGIGVKEERINEMADSELYGERKNGFGIRNIDDRIKLQYGKKFGLDISSQYGVGTTVTIRLPLNNVIDK